MVFGNSMAWNVPHTHQFFFQSHSRFDRSAEVFFLEWLWQFFYRPNTVLVAISVQALTRLPPEPTKQNMNFCLTSAFPVTAIHLWNCDSLPSHVTAAPSLSIFCCRLKSHLFSLSDSSLICTVQCPCSDSSFWTQSASSFFTLQSILRLTFISE